MAESAKDKIEIDETQQKLENVDIGGKEDVKVTYYLRDINRKMVVAWENIFKDHTDRVQVYVLTCLYIFPAKVFLKFKCNKEFHKEFWNKEKC